MRKPRCISEGMAFQDRLTELCVSPKELKSNGSSCGTKEKKKKEQLVQKMCSEVKKKKYYPDAMIL